MLVPDPEPPRFTPVFVAPRHARDAFVNRPRRTWSEVSDETVVRLSTVRVAAVRDAEPLAAK